MVVENLFNEGKFRLLSFLNCGHKVIEINDLEEFMDVTSEY